MLTKQFWLGETGVLVRAVRTFAQTFISVTVVGGSALALFSVDWKESLSISLGAALVSILMSLDRYSPGAVPLPTRAEPDVDTLHLGPHT